MKLTKALPPGHDHLLTERDITDHTLTRISL